MEKNLEAFIGYVKSTIDDKGIYPLPGWIIDQSDKLVVMSMDLKPVEVYKSIFAMGKKENAKLMMWGLDRFNKPGQGIDERFASVFTFISFNLVEMKFDVVAMPYNSKDDIGELQDDNKWWLSAVSHELRQIFPFLTNPSSN